MSGYSQQRSLQSEQTWKERNCPKMRVCWHFSWEAYNLKTSDTATLCRRICMILILGVRTALSILAVFFRAYGGHVSNVVIGVIMGVLGFFFITWCLAEIGEMQGRRKVLGTMLSRWHYDVFLAVCALIHVSMIIGFFFGPSVIVFTTSWYGMWIFLFAAAWIATWPPEEEIYV